MTSTEARWWENVASSYVRIADVYSPPVAPEARDHCRRQAELLFYNFGALETSSDKRYDNHRKQCSTKLIEAGVGLEPTSTRDHW